MIFYNSKKQPIHIGGKLYAGEKCPCSKDPCKDNICTFHPEYSSVFHMARSGGFLPYLDVNYVDIEIDGNRKRIPMTDTSYDTSPPGGDTLQLWYDPNSYDNPDTSWEEYTAFNVQQIRNGEAQIENLSRLATWAAESRFYLNEDSDSYYLQITAEYDSMPTNWNVTQESAGEYQKLFKNTLDIKFSHWHNGILVNENNTSYTARLYSLNLTQGHALVDPTVIAGVPSFSYTSVNSSYRDRYETDHSGMTFEEIVNLISEPDFPNFRWIGNGLITGMSTYYALAPDCPSGSSISFNFGFDESLKIGYYLPSIEYCHCGEPTLNYITDPIPPDPPIILDFNLTPESSSKFPSMSMSGSGSGSDSGSGSMPSISDSDSGSVSGSGSNSGSSSGGLSVSISSDSSVSSISPPEDDLYYILYASEIVCQYFGKDNWLKLDPGFYLYYTGSTSSWGTYTDPSDIPYSDGEIVMQSNWGWLFSIRGPFTAEEVMDDIAPEPPEIISPCIPDSPDCTEMSFPFPAGIIESHSYEFIAPANYMIVTEYTPPVVVDDNGNPAGFEAYLIDTVEWSEEIRFSAGSQHKLGYRSYSLEIRSRGRVTTPGKIVFRFCPV